MTQVILDTSAVLAVLLREPGRDIVVPLLPTALMSTANLAELAGVAVRRGHDLQAVRASLAALGIRFVAVSEEQAYAIGEMLPLTRSIGLSLGDRACLVLAGALSVTAYTADRVWLNVAHDLGVTVELIR